LIIFSIFLLKTTLCVVCFFDFERMINATN
jgi:hypothetical protein